ncbi:MAG: hypothetical protein QXI33_02340 [Candidatus Pacearchaeota archaeon]
MVGKKGVSAFIATTLLVLVTIVAVFLLIIFLIPFVKENLNKSAACLNVGEISIVASSSCYDSKSGRTNVSVKFGNTDVKKIYVVLDISGNSVTREYDSVPTKGGGEKIYEFQGIGNVARVGAIVNNKKCPVIEEIELSRC